MNRTNDRKAADFDISLDSSVPAEGIARIPVVESAGEQELESKSCLLPRFSFPLLVFHTLLPKEKGIISSVLDFFWFHQAPFLLIL